MECHDLELLMRVLDQNSELKRLYEEHQQLKDELSRFRSRSFLTPSEQETESQLKWRKLRGKEKMMEILNGYRGESHQIA